MKYLYGASIQGIQEFIFKTNTLKEIVGASEIVKKITEDFQEKIEANSKEKVEILLCAAGNIKAIFKDKELLQEHIKEFEKDVMQQAYGITISQAVVDITNEKYKGHKEALKELDKKLKIQRNKPSIPLDSSINIIKLSSKTAKPEVKNDKDKATLQKEETYTKWFEEKIKDNPNFTDYKEISNLSNNKNKIAVIHIDGNGLGQIVPELDIKLLSKFSLKLDSATKKAYEVAAKDKKIRDIILGGDDVTAIIDADDALDFVHKFLENFEKETSKIEELKLKSVNKNNLTACAGVAFCNEKYPFHYAVHLAEELCSEAKRLSSRSASCMMFHNVQSSYFKAWEKIVENELTIINDKETIRLDFGPYYLDDKKQPTIQDFLHTLKAYRCEGSPISRLRNYLSELYKSSQKADDLLHRINEITQSSGKWNCEAMKNNLSKLYDGLSDETMIVDIVDKNNKMRKTPLYDILQILSVK